MSEGTTMCDAMRRVAVLGLLIAGLVASVEAKARGGTVTYSTMDLRTPFLDSPTASGLLPKYDAALFGDAPLQDVSFTYSAQSRVIFNVSYPGGIGLPPETGTVILNIPFRFGLGDGTSSTDRALVTTSASTGPLTIQVRGSEEGSTPFSFGPYAFNGTGVHDSASSYAGTGNFRIFIDQRYKLISSSNPKLVVLPLFHSIGVRGTVSVTYTFAETPEPATCVLAAFGFTVLGVHGWRRRR